MTYESKEVIKQLLENDGVYTGDPKMQRIYQYNGNLYAVFMNADHDDMHLSQYVRPGYTLLFDGHITEAGKDWLAKY